ncbi:MAG: transposase [Anaerolineae bacterium]|nr:transposase [Anaerolineae bacterium]
MAWIVGLFGICLCHMTVWRDVQTLAERVRQKVRKRRVRVLGLDGLLGEVRGEGRGTVVAVDMGTGEPVNLVEIDERDVEAVVAWLRPLVEEMGIQVLVTDDLATYKVIAERLELEHQVCDFHLMRWVGRALKGLEKELGEEYQGAIEEVRRIVREKPPDGGHQLERIWESIRPLWRRRKGPLEAVHRFRMLLVRLAENWESYTLFLKQEGVPRTNNRTEQAIGRWRVPSRSVRGFKSWEGLEAAFWVCNSKVA